MTIYNDQEGMEARVESNRLDGFAIPFITLCHRAVEEPQLKKRSIRLRLDCHHKIGFLTRETALINPGAARMGNPLILSARAACAGGIPLNQCQAFEPSELIRYQFPAARMCPV